MKKISSIIIFFFLFLIVSCSNNKTINLEYTKEIVFENINVEKEIKVNIDLEKIKFRSLDNSIASISKDKVLSKKEGRTKIEITYNKNKFFVDILVKLEDLKNVKLSNRYLTFSNTYETKEIKLLSNNKKIDNISWSILDDSVAKINNNGIITPLNNGSTYAYGMYKNKAYEVYIKVDVSNQAVNKLPDYLINNSFSKIEDNILYEIRFSENKYLFISEKDGILYEKNAYINQDSNLILDTPGGIIKTNNFNKNNINFTLGKINLSYHKSNTTSEYIYLKNIGIYSGVDKNNKKIVLNLERFYEYYITYDNNTISGKYDIKNNNIILSNDKNQIEILDNTKLKYKDIILNYVTIPNNNSYLAVHPMGNYTLTLLDNNLFVIIGRDKLVKAYGTIDINNNIVSYLKRDIVINNPKPFNILKENNKYIFPKETPLLPGSGNITPQTNNKGTYWNAGAKLVFEKLNISPKDNTKYNITINIENNVKDIDIYLNGKKIGNTENNSKYIIENVLDIKYLTFSKNNYKFPIFKTDKNNNSFNVLPEKLNIELKNLLPDKKYLKPTMPSIGVAKPVVLLVDFPDHRRPRLVEKNDIQKGLFSLDNYGSLSSYYFRSSYGRLKIEGEVLDWYRAKNNRNSYTPEDIMKEALQYHISNGLDIDKYDSNNDSIIDSVIVIWAGSLDSSNFNYNGAFRSVWRRIDQPFKKNIEGYIYVPGLTIYSIVKPIDITTTSLIHETGHLLGLSDYYSYDREEKLNNDLSFTGGALEGGLGTMDMMDSNIGDHNAYSKYMLGWIDPIVVDDIKNIDKVLKLRSTSIYQDAIFIKLRNEKSLLNELFVVELITKDHNFSSLHLENSVIRIMHVDSRMDKDGLIGNWRAYGFLNDNSYTTNKFIHSIEADGLDTFLNFYKNKNQKLDYEEKDFFKKGSVISNNTYPNTNSYDEYGNSTIDTKLEIKIADIKDGFATIKLTSVNLYDTIKIVSIDPKPIIVPNTIDNFTRLDLDSKIFTYTFNKNIKEINSDKIFILENNSLTKLKYNTKINNNKLIIEFISNLNSNSNIRIVIQKDAVKAADNTLNNYNLIHGYLTKKTNSKLTDISFNFGEKLVFNGLNKQIDILEYVIPNSNTASVNELEIISSNSDVGEVIEQIILTKKEGITNITIKNSDGSISKSFILEIKKDTYIDKYYSSKYIDAMSTTLEFELYTYENNLVQIKRLDGKYQGGIVLRGKYSISNNIFTIKVGDNTFDLQISKDDKNVSTLEGRLPTGGAYTDLLFKKVK